MTESQHRFRALLAQARAGSEEAKRRLIKTYEPLILCAVRRALGPPLRTDYDSADFVQEAWLQFFGKLIHDHDFEVPAQFVLFMVKLSRNKVGMALRRYFETQKRGGKRTYAVPADLSEVADQVIDPRPGPLNHLMAQDDWQRLIASVPRPHGQILNALRNGYTHQEIADLLGTSTRTIRGLLNYIRHLPRE
jgi:RNA polymerase sigma-70 factor (ECF subfamily)